MSDINPNRVLEALDELMRACGQSTISDLVSLNPLLAGAMRDNSEMRQLMLDNLAKQISGVFATGMAPVTEMFNDPAKVAEIRKRYEDVLNGTREASGGAGATSGDNGEEASAGPHSAS